MIVGIVIGIVITFVIKKGVVDYYKTVIGK